MDHMNDLRDDLTDIDDYTVDPDDFKTDEAYREAFYTPPVHLNKEEGKVFRDLLRYYESAEAADREMTPRWRRKANEHARKANAGLRAMGDTRRAMVRRAAGKRMGY